MENPWIRRSRITQQEVDRLNLEAIKESAERLGTGDVHLHDIPVDSFYNPRGNGFERSGVLHGLTKAVEETLNEGKKKFNISGGTWGGIERGVIHIRRDI